LVPTKDKRFRGRLRKEKNQNTLDKFLSDQKVLGKSDNTLEGYKVTLYKLGHFLEDKDFEKADSEDLKAFFKKESFSPTVRNISACRIMLFYRCLLNLSKREPVENMKWYEYSSKEEKQRYSDPKQIEKQRITKDEYNSIIANCRDNQGMEQALWETYYLSGGRPSEILNLKVGDVDIKKQQITIRISKTQGRTITLPEEPVNLIRWLGNHPFKDNSDSSLWISFSSYAYLQPLTTLMSIRDRFVKAVERAGITDWKERKLSIHCFRKTRASIYWSDVDKNGYHKWDTKEMAHIFGWTISTAEKRREEYDTRNVAEVIHDKLTKEKKHVTKTYDELLNQNKKLVKEKDDKIKHLEEKVNRLNDFVAKEHFDRQSQQDIEKYYEKKQQEMQERYDRILQNLQQQFENLQGGA